MKDSLKLGQEPQGCIYSRTQMYVWWNQRVSGMFWGLWPLSCERVCVFQQQQAVSYPLTPPCPSSARCHTGSRSAREVPSTDCLELIGTCEKSQRVKGGNSHALDPAAHPMSPQCMQRNRGKKGGGDTLVFDTSVNKERRLLKTTEH